VISLSAVAATYTAHNKQEKNSHALDGIQTRDPSHQAVSDLHFTPHGHWQLAASSH
jgi:hypothetical protein